MPIGEKPSPLPCNRHQKRTPSLATTLPGRNPVPGRDRLLMVTSYQVPAIFFLSVISGFCFLFLPLPGRHVLSTRNCNIMH